MRGMFRPPPFASQRMGHPAPVMLAQRRCPHCGYDLRLLPVDPEDAATIRPECGSAWKLGYQTSRRRPRTGPEE